MQQLLLATGNAGKVREIQHALADHHWNIIPQSEFGIVDSVEETGLTFVENAIIKARHASAITGLPALADDSGLVVDALNGAPGIYSARYAGKDVPFSANIEKLLQALKTVPDSERTARFYCVIVYLSHAHDPAPLICQGVWGGRILATPTCQDGFGYDPVFYVLTHDCSASDLPLAEKNRISHRGQAITQLTRLLA